MKKLFLTSQFLNVSQYLKDLLPAQPKDLTAAFIPSAADPYENKSFVDADRRALTGMGFTIVDLPLADRPVQDLESKLRQADLVFVEGGNSFYLLDRARKSGFASVLPPLVEAGLLYVGVSAGSYLACPTIEMAGWKHQDRNVVGLKDLAGLSLVPFLLSVHYKPEYITALREGAAKTPYPVKILTDDQALVVEGDVVRLVGKGSLISLRV